MWCSGSVVVVLIIIITIKSLFIEGTGISEHKCVKIKIKNIYAPTH